MKLQQALNQVMARTEPRTKARSKALASVKWRLRNGLLYAGLNGSECVLTDMDNALVFDGRDNEAMKLRYYQAVTGYQFEVELCVS